MSKISKKWQILRKLVKNEENAVKLIYFEEI